MQQLVRSGPFSSEGAFLTAVPPLEHAEGELKGQMQDMEVKKTLLDGFDIRLEDEHALLKAYTSRLQALFARFQTRCAESYVKLNLQFNNAVFSGFLAPWKHRTTLSELTEQRGALLDDTQVKLDQASSYISAHMRQVLGLYQIAAAENRPAPISELESGSAELVTKIQGILSTIQPRSFAAGLLEQAKQQAEDLVSELGGATTAARQEAEVIRRQVEEEFLMRSSIAVTPLLPSDPTNTADGAAGKAPPFPTTEGLLQGQREDHFNRFIAIERARNEAHSVWKQVRQLERSQLNSADAENDPSAANGAGSKEPSLGVEFLRQLESELAGEQAALLAAKQIFEQLCRSKELYEKDMKQLEEKKGRISELDNVLQAKQELVTLLLKQNAASRGQLTRRFQQLRKSETAQAFKLDSQLKGTAASLKDAAMSEIRDLMDLTVSSLARNPETGERYADMSINSGSRVAALSASIGMTGTVQNKSPEAVLLDARNTIWETDALQESLSQRKEQMRVSGMSKELVDLTDLVVQAGKAEQDQVAGWVPVLVTQIDQTKKATELCTSLREMVQDWSEQPSQHLASWVQVEGEPLRAWQAKWTELRQGK